MNLYVIGPVTGIENDNRSEFERVRYFLWNDGKHLADIPHDFVVSETQWNIAMLKSIHALTTVTQCGDGSSKPKYDGIALLDGWRNSKGAKIEHDLAEALGIPCKPWRKWI